MLRVAVSAAGGRRRCILEVGELLDPVGERPSTTCAFRVLYIVQGQISALIGEGLDWMVTGSRGRSLAHGHRCR